MQPLLGAFPFAQAGILKRGPGQSTLADHFDNAKGIGLHRYLYLEEHVHHSTGWALPTHYAQALVSDLPTRLSG